MKKDTFGKVKTDLQYDGPDKPLKIKSGYWDLIGAISLIRTYQSRCHELGFNLARRTLYHCFRLLPHLPKIDLIVFEI